MSQKVDKGWERLESVIAWSNMTINYFAGYIGLSRSEAIYRVKRGDNGLSRNMAERVVSAFPQVSLMWLLDGQGDMLVANDSLVAQIDLYDVDVEQAAGEVLEGEPTMKLVLPLAVDGDVAMRYCGAAMSNTIPANSVVIIKEVARESIIPGGEYVVVSDNVRALRTVRRASTPPAENVWRLVASQGELYDDIFVAEQQIVKLFRVEAKLLINN